eukprot:gene15328-18160_t
MSNEEGKRSGRKSIARRALPKNILEQSPPIAAEPATSALFKSLDFGSLFGVKLDSSPTVPLATISSTSNATVTAATAVVAVVPPSPTSNSTVASTTAAAPPVATLSTAASPSLPPSSTTSSSTTTVTTTTAKSSSATAVPSSPMTSPTSHSAQHTRDNSALPKLLLESDLLLSKHNSTAATTTVPVSTVTAAVPTAKSTTSAAPVVEEQVKKAAAEKAEKAAATAEKEESPRTTTTTTTTPTPAKQQHSRKAKASKSKKDSSSPKEIAQNKKQEQAKRVEEEEEEDDEESESIIRCICANNIDHGLMIQCERCDVWQHSICFGISKPANVPKHYYCERCKPPVLNCVCERKEAVGKITECTQCKTWHHIACINLKHPDRPYTCQSCERLDTLESTVEYDDKHDASATTTTTAQSIGTPKARKRKAAGYGTRRKKSTSSSSAKKKDAPSATPTLGENGVDESALTASKDDMGTDASGNNTPMLVDSAASSPALKALDVEAIKESFLYLEDVQPLDSLQRAFKDIKYAPESPEFLEALDLFAQVESLVVRESFADDWCRRRVMKTRMGTMPTCINNLTIDDNILFQKYCLVFSQQTSPAARDTIKTGIQVLLQLSSEKVHAYMTAYAKELLHANDVPVPKDEEINSSWKQCTESQYVGQQPFRVTDSDQPHFSTSFEITTASSNNTTPSLIVSPSLKAMAESRLRPVGARVLAALDTPSNTQLDEYIGVVCDAMAVRAEWADGSSFLVETPSPFVLFPGFKAAKGETDFCIDARTKGSLTRFVRRSCAPSARALFTMGGPDGNKVRAALYSRIHLEPHAEVTIGFDWSYKTLKHAIACPCATATCSVASWFNERASLAIRMLEMLGVAVDESIVRREQERRENAASPIVAPPKKRLLDADHNSTATSASVTNIKRNKREDEDSTVSSTTTTTTTTTTVPTATAKKEEEGSPSKDINGNGGEHSTPSKVAGKKAWLLEFKKKT